MKHARQSIQAVFLVLAIACASPESNFRMEDAQQVKIGMTQDEVLHLMGGKPSHTSVIAGAEMWTWNYVAATPEGSKSKSFAVRFLGGKVSWIQR